MKESYSEVLARHAGPESYADRGNTLGVATAGVDAGPVLSSVNRFIPCADAVQAVEGNIDCAHDGKHDSSMVESKTWCMYENSKRENREILSASTGQDGMVRHAVERSENVTDGNADMHADRKSDDFVVLSTRVNKAAAAVAESVEERESPKGSIVVLPWTFRTPSRASRHLHGTAITTGSETSFRDR